MKAYVHYWAHIKTFSWKVERIASAQMKTKVWVPDPFFANQREGHVLDNPADNTLFRISRNGDLHVTLLFVALHIIFHGLRITYNWIYQTAQYLLVFKYAF